MAQSYHFGWIYNCGTAFRFMCVRWVVVIQWRNVGFYAGWFDDELWQELKQKGRVGDKNPWWYLPFEFPWRSIR